ncbi:ribbon-helix-helix protein, CopG family [Actinomyces oricola]|uniref:ribbon-helix-helix protein, CopG family n=1 Tax=Actinomyces oricola TaxID=206043 RepID=UPI0030C7D37C
MKSFVGGRLRPVKATQSASRSSAGRGPGTVVPVRLDEAALAALTARAEAEGLATRSDAVRAAVRAWVHSTWPTSLRP